MVATRFVLVVLVFWALFLKSAPLVASEATGLITLDGKPLAAGKITFYRGNGQFVGSKVKDGKYTIDQLPLGTLKVTFEGESVPAKYAFEETSGIVVEVKDGPVKFSFDLK